MERTFQLEDPLDFEPSSERSIAALARHANRPLFDYVLEQLLKDGGTQLLLHPFENYHSGDLRVVRVESD